MLDTTDIPAIKARRNLGELMNKTYYLNYSYRIFRDDKPLARLVSEYFMQALDKIIEEDPALGDTIALMLNTGVRKTIEQGNKEYKAGKKIPLEKALGKQ